MILKKDSHPEYSGQAISLKLPADLLAIADRCSTALGMSRARYSRAAIERINRDTLESLRNSRLEEVSRRVRKDSSEINNGMRILQKRNNG